MDTQLGLHPVAVSSVRGPQVDVTMFFLYFDLYLPKVSDHSVTWSKLWGRILLQIGDNPSALFLYLCVNFHKCSSVAF